MYTPHQSMHQFSPQRRQRLGATKRLGQQKALLGEDEASSVGPQKLFSDLKSTTGKNIGSFSTLKKSPSRALDVKNTQSPQRLQDGPVKPSIGSVKSVVKSLEGNADSSTKGKLKSHSRMTEAASPQKAVQLSPIRPEALQDLDEGTSYHTVATPFHKEPRTPPADRLDATSISKRPVFETPAGNIGEAGAVRMRKGEVFDAMNAGPKQNEEMNMTGTDVTELREEELYPEVEYMPPSVDVPYDFPLEFDDLPKAKELGERMSKVSLIGFYRPSNEERKQEMLSEIFRLRPAKIEELEKPALRPEADDELWPDIEVAVPSKVSSHNLTKKEKSVPSQRGLLGSKSKAAMNTKVTGESAQKNRTLNGTSKKIIAAKPKALGVRDSNTTVKKVMNPALRDFENDEMGKIIKAKLAAIDSREPEGFLL